MKFKIDDLEYEVTAIGLGRTGELKIEAQNGLTKKTVFVEASVVLDLTKVEAQMKERKRAALEKEKSHFQTKLKEIEAELKSLK